MSVEPIDFAGGAGRAKIVCDDCRRSEVVPCAYSNRGIGKEREGRPNESQARSRALAMGWSFVKGKLRCGACEAKRKVGNMRIVKSEKPAEKPREATREQKRAIMQMLETVYDAGAGRYMQGDTDATVAEVLNVMPGWVAELRDEFFGPDGGNDDIERLRNEIAEFRAQMTARVKANTEENKSLIEQIERAKGFAERLDRISKAIGPGARKKAGIA